MRRRKGQYLFAAVVGLLVAWGAYSWITNPDGRSERALQERAVAHARVHLQTAIAAGELEIVDPLAPNRKVGKVYVFRESNGWSVSGHYRRDEEAKWHPFLMHLDAAFQPLLIKVDDDDLELAARAALDVALEVSN